MTKDANVLTWVFFCSKGITDNTDLMRCNILCMEICRQGDKATVESIKNTSAFVGCNYDVPVSDELIQEIIDWK